MRTARLSVQQHPVWMVVVFVAALVASFFSLGTVASACVADVVIHKTEIGAAAPGAAYTFVMTGPDFRREVVVDAGASTVIAGVPPGEYWFEEVGAPSGATIDPNPITIESLSYDQRVDVYATNPYLAGRLAITKVTTGSTAPSGPYTFDITGPAELSATVTPGTTWTSDWLPLGTYTITERDAPAGATITPNPVTIDTDGETATVTATNPYRDAQAKLEIVKVVAGGGTTPAGPWTIDVTGPVSFTAQIATGETWTSAWLPLGTYTVTERNAPAGATITPDPVVLGTDGQTVRVVVTNPAVESEGATTTTIPTTIPTPTPTPTPTTVTPPRTLAATGAGTSSGTIAPLAMLVLMTGTALAGAVRIRRPR